MNKPYIVFLWNTVKLNLNFCRMENFEYHYKHSYYVELQPEEVVFLQLKYDDIRIIENYHYIQLIILTAQTLTDDRIIKILNDLRPCNHE